jgi:hypothetical protein
MLSTRRLSLSALKVVTLLQAEESTMSHGIHSSCCLFSWHGITVMVQLWHI